MNLDTTTGGSAAVGAMLSVLLAHFSGETFTATEMAALAAGFGAIVGWLATRNWRCKDAPQPEETTSDA